MDIQNLSAFITVSEKQSFSKAAELLFITQPAVSKRIAALETELNTRLFDRIGRQVQLTEAGRALLPSALRILAELEESKRAIGNLNEKVSGKLSIATSHHIGLHRLPPVLRAYTRKYPDVDLDLQFMDSEEACNCVLKGEVDLAIATLPEQDWPKLQSQIIWRDPLDVVISTQHPQASSPRIDVSSLSKIPAILPSQNTFTRELLENALGLNHQNLNIAMETNYLETIKMMVSIGLGWSVLPVSMVTSDIAIMHIKGIEFERLLGVVSHQHRTLSNAAKMLMLELHSASKNQS
ncbi:MAG: LysR family transcriptional regulator [endosymbiont of Galathealinum brachiosum]|uniref:LysR family transcriptional regulator n=1 Tax=endosymbiont of Galathealinum brachiosum TaxID=2200906 RepID=A0A370DL16_9GAMM|nr:MAG: LysR family transcriptional regulator [endosymbiont of Galathealinum brachiosum]